MLPHSNYDVLIIGSGAAGLALALTLSDHARVAILSKDDLMAGSSQRAQGGIAAVMSAEDSIESHVQDTLKAGAGLCDPEVVQYTAAHAKSAIMWLIDHGVQFTVASEQGDYHLTREGGHSHRRILHAADRTGAVVVKTLAEQVSEHPNIDCLTQHTVIDLIVQKQQCYGAYIYDGSKHQEKIIQAKHIILATGGASSLYLHTSNSNQTTGDGIAMAWRAGCRVANLEFNQFHPTCLYHPEANRFLITEVVRGEGGYLKLPNGKRFMQQYDERAEMAPRDIVTRAIDAEMKKNNIECVYLDISHRSADFIENTFPTIFKQCKKFGIDITKQPIPVVPAAHYTCGGVVTNLHGETDIKNLYAIGEVAYTGLHGANRMASNSLLECLVFAANASCAIKQKLMNKNNIALPIIPKISHHAYDHSLDIESLELQIRKILWNNVGIVRSNALLQEASEKIAAICAQINSAYHHTALSNQLIEVRNMAIVAQLIIGCAQSRHESRGLHYNIDYPNTNEKAENTLLHPTASSLDYVTAQSLQIL
ncbi:L-aspartate oxidase [Candidiatus Paracoxiella cheracis]|uniref:L-aspartate oxidase n=1 Tax=Candidiatus Paracoxiella cheracis TaxID=3405120 RepID=UPI003BF4D5E3